MEYRKLHHHLESIRDRLIQMGGEVEGMIAAATEALVQRDDRLVDAVIDRDHQVDRLEMEVDEACHSVLARNQPTAVDMRFLVAVMKITGDLERMGDSAVNIVQAARQLNKQPRLEPTVDLPRMSEQVQTMVRRSLDAFVRRDARQAAQVCKDDDIVDDHYRQIFAELMTMMTGDPKTVTRAVHLLLVARNLERIADHATNIAEDVIYYVEGRDIRHSLADTAP
jgi:phosphate transport system protein